MTIKTGQGTWGGKREGSGKPRSNKPRCACGVMTAKRALTRRHKCQVLSNAVFSQEKGESAKATEYKLDMAGFDSVKHSAPPFRLLVVVPVLVDGEDSGVVIHVGTTWPSSIRVGLRPSDLVDRIMDVAGRLMLVDEKMGAPEGAENG